MIPETKSPLFAVTRLDTWKSIAQYLGRSSRTAQRWHTEYGLPVHHLGGNASSVFAYTDKLDAWMRKRTQTVAEFTTEPQGPRVLRIVARPASVGLAVSKSTRTNLPSGSNERRGSELAALAQKMWESLSESNLDTIARLYREASDLDPLNAAAFAGLSQALIAEGVLGRVHTSHAYPPAIAALNRALEIDPDLFEAKCASALLKILVQRDWEGAREDFDEALAIRPPTTFALVGRALYAIAQASLCDASKLLREATILRPLNSSVIALLCWSEYLSGRFEDALRMAVQARDTGHTSAVLDAVEALSSVLLCGAKSQIEQIESRAKGSPKHFGLLGVLGYCYGMTGQTQKAVDLLDSMTELGMRGNCDYAYAIALTFLGINDQPKAIEWLEESYLQGSLWSLAFLSDPILASLRDDRYNNHFFSRFHYPEVAELRVR